MSRRFKRVLVPPILLFIAWVVLVAFITTSLRHSPFGIPVNIALLAVSWFIGRKVRALYFFLKRADDEDTNSRNAHHD